jgi:hypothetical protein
MSSSMSAPRGITGLQYAHLLQAVVFFAIAILLALSRAAARILPRQVRSRVRARRSSPLPDAPNAMTPMAARNSPTAQLSSVAFPRSKILKPTWARASKMRSSGTRFFSYLQPLIERERLSGTRQQGSVASGPK